MYLEADWHGTTHCFQYIEKKVLENVLKCVFICQKEYSLYGLWKKRMAANIS